MKKREKDRGNFDELIGDFVFVFVFLFLFLFLFGLGANNITKTEILQKKDGDEMSILIMKV